MKKIVLILMILVIAITIVSCGESNNNKETQQFSFTQISQSGIFRIYKEETTQVLYVGTWYGISPMVNACGNPIVYSEWLNLSR